MRQESRHSPSGFQGRPSFARALQGLFGPPVADLLALPRAFLPILAFLLAASLLAGCSGDDVTLPGEIPPEAPRPIGAFFVDVDGGGPSKGDVVGVAFDRPVYLQGDMPQGFAFDRPTDTFGTGAALSQSVPGSDRIEVTLGDAPSLVPGTYATPGVTLINVASSGWGVVQVMGTNGFRAGHADSSQALVDLTAAAPRLLTAVLVDTDSSGSYGAGDRILATFDKPISVPGGSTVAANFELPVADDSFGTAPVLAAASAAPANRVVLITLGPSPVITVPGVFAAGAVAPGSPSGLRTAAAPTIRDTQAAAPVSALAGVAVDVVSGGTNLPGDGRAAENELASGRFQRPTDVLVVQGKLIVSDTEHHRILIYNSVPVSDDPAPDVVLGQADAAGTSPNRGGPPTAATLKSPTYLATDGTRLIVADTGNHRVLVYNTVPAATGAAANVILGQATADGGLPNAGGATGANTLSSPKGVAASGGWLIVADSGNNRALFFAPLAGLVGFDAPSLVLGQDVFNLGYANQGFYPSRSSLKAPEDVAVGAGRVYVADAGNHRVLCWEWFPDSNGKDASGLFGQVDFETAVQAGAAPNTLLSPAGLALDPQGAFLAVGDTGHSRIVFFNDISGTRPEYRSASSVVGQKNLLLGQPNGGAAAAGAATLNEAKGIFWNGYDLIAADSGNDRVTMYR